MYFVSYSRKDLDFVLELVKDLRRSGIDLWLDHLDIPAGSRWDNEIEAALEASKGMIAVLSPGSLGSENFKDEISFALEEGKVIVPLVLKPCKVPFRLRRLQRVDFSKGYESGLVDLRRALDIETSARPEQRHEVPLAQQAPSGQMAPATQSQSNPDLGLQQGLSDPSPTSGAFGSPLDAPNPTASDPEQVFGSAQKLAAPMSIVLEGSTESPAPGAHVFSLRESLRIEEQGALKIFLGLLVLALGVWLVWHYEFNTKPESTGGEPIATHSAVNRADMLPEEENAEEPSKSSAPPTRSDQDQYKSQPQKTELESDEKPKASSKGPTTAADGFVIQVFSTRDEPNALKVQKDVSNQGFRAFLVAVQISGQPMYRVQVGPYQNRADADNGAAAIRRLLKLDPWVTTVKPE